MCIRFRIKNLNCSFIMFKFLSFITIIIGLGVSVSQAQTNKSSSDSNKGLKDYYASYFPVGVAVSPHALKTDEAKLIVQQCNSLTPENAMKMGPIHPKEKEYYWKDADTMVAFAQR